MAVRVTYLVWVRSGVFEAGFLSDGGVVRVTWCLWVDTSHVRQWQARRVDVGAVHLGCLGFVDGSLVGHVVDVFGRWSDVVPLSQASRLM